MCLQIVFNLIYKSLNEKKICILQKKLLYLYHNCIDKEAFMYKEKNIKNKLYS